MIPLEFMVSGDKLGLSFEQAWNQCEAQVRVDGLERPSPAFRTDLGCAQADGQSFKLRGRRAGVVDALQGQGWATPMESANAARSAREIPPPFPLTLVVCSCVKPMPTQGHKSKAGDRRHRPFESMQKAKFLA